MVRPGVLSVSLALAVGFTRVAWAGGTRKVTIESDPPGAHVYLNEKEDGVACEATPCTIDVPLGETPLIVELENYAPSITMLDIAKGRGPLKQMVKLTAAGGGIDAKALPGKTASVKVDDEDKGVAPLKIPIDAGPHHVAYFVDGKQVYEEYIEVEASPDFYALTPKLSAIPPGPSSDDANPLDPPDGGDVHKEAPSLPHGRVVTASVLFDVGFRQFSYSNGTGSHNRPESEGGQLLAGPLIEFYPTALFAPKTLPNLALVGRFEQGFNNQTVTGMDIAHPTTTYWQSLEVSVRQRWQVADGKASVDASVGFVQDRLQFNGVDTDIALVPDASYEAVRIGTRGALLVGNLEPYVVLEERVVTSEGNLGLRYSHASANGLHAAAGLAYHHGAITARIEGQLTRYSSTFSQATPSATDEADGASDVVELISLSAGYTY